MPIDRPRLIRPIGDTNFVKGDKLYFVVEIPNCKSDHVLRFYKLPELTTIALQVNLTENCRNAAGSTYQNEGVAYKEISLDLDLGEYLIEIVNDDTGVVTTGGAIKIVNSLVPPAPPAAKKTTAKAKAKPKPKTKTK